MADSQLDQKRLNELRGYVTKLSFCEKELRDLLREYVKQSGSSLNTIASRTGSNWAAISGLLEGRRVILKDTIVNKLAHIVGMDNKVAQEIIVIGEKVPHRYLGLAAFNQGVIDIVFDLLVAHNAVSDEYGMAEFAKAFAQYEQTVLDALNLSRESFEELQDNSTLIDGILEVLIDDTSIEQKLKKVKETHAKQRELVIAEIDRRVAKLLPRYSDKLSLVSDLGLRRGSLDRRTLLDASDTQVDKLLSILKAATEKDSAFGEEIKLLNELYKRLYKGYGSQSVVAKALGVPSSTLSDALRGKVNQVRLSSLIAKATALTSTATKPGWEAETQTELPEKVQQAPEPQASTLESSDDPFHGLAGSTIQGAQHVLTADNFREIVRIVGVSATDIVDALVKSAQMTSGLLALVAQLKGDEVRWLMQQPTTERQLRTLYNNLEIATNTHPNPLLALYDEHRKLWDSKIGPNRTRKGDTAHG